MIVITLVTFEENITSSRENYSEMCYWYKRNMKKFTLHSVVLGKDSSNKSKDFPDIFFSKSLFSFDK